MEDDKLTVWLTQFVLWFISLMIGVSISRWLTGAGFAIEAMAVRVVLAAAAAAIAATFVVLKRR